MGEEVWDTDLHERLCGGRRGRRRRCAGSVYLAPTQGPLAASGVGRRAHGLRRGDCGHSAGGRVTARGKEHPASPIHRAGVTGQHGGATLSHDRLEAAARAHETMAPGHMEVPGNEIADDEAKKAARDECSAAVPLPARLRKSLPCSVTAATRAHLGRLRKEAGGHHPPTREYTC